MNILYVIPFFKPYEVGGAEVSTYLHADAFRREYNIIVLTPNYRHLSDRTSYDKKKFIIHRFAFPFKPKRIMMLFDTCIFQFYVFLQTLIAIKKFNIDLVHIQSSSLIPGPFFASRLLRRKVVLTIRDHGYRFTKDGLKNELRKFSGIKSILKPWVACITIFNYNLRKFCIKRMDRIVTVSAYMKECLTKRVGVDQRKVDVSYMLMPAWDKRGGIRKSNKYTLLFLGRLDKAKGIELLLDSFSSLKQKNIELLIAGNSNIGHYREFVRKRGIRNVVFLGKVSYKRIREVYDKSDTVIVPSMREEPLSRVLIEAGSLGKTVIATDRGGSREVVIDKKTGILVKDVTPKGLANAMEYVIRNPARAKEMGKNIKKLANSMFDPEKNLKVISKIYRELL